MHIYIYIYNDMYMYMYTCMYVYIYIYIERERFMYVNIYVYIHIYDIIYHRGGHGPRALPPRRAARRLGAGGRLVRGDALLAVM